MGTTDDFADIFTRRDVDILRFEAGQRENVVALLRDLRTDLADQIRRIDPSGAKRNTYQVARLKKLDESAAASIKKYYTKGRNQGKRDLVGMAKNEVDYVQAQGNAIVGSKIFSALPPEEVIQELVDNTHIEGDLYSDWWARQSRQVRVSFKTQMRIGVTAGEGTQALVDRLRNTVVSTAKARLETLVRTSVTGVQNAARLKVYEANKDKLRGIQALVTLDARTSEICIARAGNAWSVKTGRPLKGTQGHFPGPPPWHWNCRTRLVPIVYNADKAEDLSYETWLKKQPESVQRKVLGKGKLQLWKDGKIGLGDLIDQRGRPLTLKQLLKKYDPKALGKTPAEFPKFQPAKTVSGAEKYARTQKLAESVNYEGMDVEAANETNRALYDLQRKGYRPPRQVKASKEPFGDAFASATGRNIDIYPQSFNGAELKKLDSETVARYARQSRKREAELTELRKIRDMAKPGDGEYERADRRIKRREAPIAKRWVVGQESQQARGLYHTIIHEYGHIAHWDMPGGLDYGYARLGGRKGSPIGGLMSEKGKQAALKVSEYATTNTKEYFAESWTAYHLGQDGLLQAGVLEVVEEVAKRAKVKQ